MANVLYIALAAAAIIAILLDVLYGSSWMVTDPTDKQEKEEQSDDSSSLPPISMNDGVNQKKNPFITSFSENSFLSMNTASSSSSFFNGDASSSSVGNFFEESEEWDGEPENLVHTLDNDLNSNNIVSSGSSVDNDESLSTLHAAMVSNELKAAQGLRYENCSRLRCFETDFTSSPKTDLWGSDGVKDGVCASKTANPLDGNCHVSSKTWHAARVYCGHSGARLCLAEELAKGHGWNTGCGSSGMFMWSNTACMSNGVKGYVQVNQQRLLGGLSEHEKCVPVTGVAEASPICCADVSCKEDADMLRTDSLAEDVGQREEGGVANRKEVKKAQPLITNGRIAVLLFGETARPGCTQSGRVAQLAAAQWQKDLMFSMLRAKGFGVDVFLATNDCGSGWVEALKRAYSPWLRGISVSNVCELSDDSKTASSASGIIPTKFNKKPCFLQTALAMLDSHSHLACSQMINVQGSLRASLHSQSSGESSRSSLAEKFLLPLTRYTGGEYDFAGCSSLSPFNTVLIGRADFIPKPNYGAAMIMDMVAAAQSSDYPTRDHIAWPFRCGAGGYGSPQKEWDKWRCVEDSLISIPAVRFDVFRDTCLGRAGCYGSGSNARHFIGDELTKQDVYGPNREEGRGEGGGVSRNWGGSPQTAKHDGEETGWSGEFRARRLRGSARLNHTGEHHGKLSGLDERRKRIMMAEDGDDIRDGFGLIPTDEYKSGKACFRCATRALERYPLRNKVFNDSQFVGAGEYKCIAMTKNDQHPSAARCEAACAREGYYPTFSTDIHTGQRGRHADAHRQDKHGLGVDGGVNRNTRQRKCSSWNVRRANPLNGTVPDSIALLGLKVAKCSQLRCRQTSFTSPQELMGMVPTQDPQTCASKTALPLDGSCSVKDGTWIDAKDTCESVGARLCSLDDLESGLGWGTGCKSNKAYLWTSTPCADFPADSYGWYYQVNQSESTAGNAHRKCSPMTDRLTVSPVCCADSFCNQGGETMLEPGMYRGKIESDVDLESALLVLGDDALNTIEEMNKKNGNGDVGADEEIGDFSFKPVSVLSLVDPSKSQSTRNEDHRSSSSQGQRLSPNALKEQERAANQKAEEDQSHLWDNSFIGGELNAPQWSNSKPTKEDELADPYPMSNFRQRSRRQRRRRLRASNQTVKTTKSSTKRNKEEEEEEEVNLQKRRRLGCHWVGWKNQQVCDGQEAGAGSPYWKKRAQGGDEAVGLGVWGAKWESDNINNPAANLLLNKNKEFSKSLGGPKPMTMSGRNKQVNDDDDDDGPTQVDWKFNAGSSSSSGTSASRGIKAGDRSQTKPVAFAPVTWQVLKQREARRQEKRKEAELEAEREREEAMRQQAAYNRAQEDMQRQKQSNVDNEKSKDTSQDNHEADIPSPLKGYYWPFKRPNGKPLELQHDNIKYKGKGYPKFDTCRDIQKYELKLENMVSLLETNLKAAQQELSESEAKLKQANERMQMLVSLASTDDDNGNTDDDIDNRAAEGGSNGGRRQLSSDNAVSTLSLENSNEVTSSAAKIDKASPAQSSLLSRLISRSKPSDSVDGDNIDKKAIDKEAQINLRTKDISAAAEQQQEQELLEEEEEKGAQMTAEELQLELKAIIAATEEAKLQHVKIESDMLKKVSQVNSAVENKTEISQMVSACFEAYRKLAMHRSEQETATASQQTLGSGDMSTKWDSFTTLLNTSIPDTTSKGSSLNEKVTEFCCLNRGVGLKKMKLGHVSGIMSVDEGHGLAGLTVGFVRDSTQIQQISESAGEHPFFSFAHGVDVEVDL